MEGKLLKILEDYLHNLHVQSPNSDALNISIYVSYFWYCQITTEAVSHLGHWKCEIGPNQELSFSIGGDKLTFSISSGFETNKETHDFFKIIYDRLP